MGGFLIPPELVRGHLGTTRETATPSPRFQPRHAEAIWLTEELDRGLLAFLRKPVFQLLQIGRIEIK
jgi:hypothetical protein